MAQTLFVDIGIMIILATIGGIVAHYIRQPLIPAYILVGILLGPVLGLLTQPDIIEGFGATGIAFLLFIVGLELDVKKLKGIGPISTIGTAIQVAITVLLGIVVMTLLGYGTVESVSIGFIIAFSSTMIVVKGLSDGKEIHTLHGRIIIGILLMQDVIAIFALSVLGSANGFSAVSLLVSMTKAVLVLVGAWLCSRFIFPHIFKRTARTAELLLMSAISVCFFFSIVFHLIGFSIAIGAFVGGVSLASLPYNLEIIGRVKSLRDFFATFFFVSLGATLALADLKSVTAALLAIIASVLLLKPLLLMAICAFFGYARRVSFLTSVNLAQVSEFSLILAAQGLALGNISKSTHAITILAALVTFLTTSYTTAYQQRLYEHTKGILAPFDLMTRGRGLEYLPEEQKASFDYPIVLVGYDRLGFSILTPFQKKKKNFIAIDYNPDIIRRLKARRIPCIYGDIGDPEILGRIDAKNLRMLISTVPTYEDNVRILNHVRRENKKATVFVTAETIDDALQLYKKGADYVILSHFLGSERVGLLLDELGDNIKSIAKNKKAHIRELRQRQRLEHEHPGKLH